MSDDPPYLPVGTEISAKFKGAFCEAKVKKLVRSVKCKVTFKDASGGSAVLDETSVKGSVRVGAVVDATHPETKQIVSAVIQSVKDCSSYTVVFDDGDERVLRRTQMVLKGGKHFHASESLDVMPLTKPEQFGAPVLNRRKGGRRRQPTGTTVTTDSESESTSSSNDERTGDPDESADSGAESVQKRSRGAQSQSNLAGRGGQSDYGRVVCVFEQDSKDSRRWFPALIVSPKAKKTLKINTSEEYLVRSFKDGRYLVVSKARIQEFNLSKGKKVDSISIKQAVGKAILYLEKDKLPAHWDRERLLGDLTAGDDDVERSSPVSHSSDAASPDRGSIDERWRGKETRRSPFGDEKKYGKSADDRSESSTVTDFRERTFDASDSDDPHSPEVGRQSKDPGLSNADKATSKSPSPQRAGTSSQKKRTIAGKRRLQRYQQSRKRNGSVSSERKDRFVAQLYKFMDERGTPINKAPVLAGKELDLYLFYDTVKKLGGYNRVNHKNEWRTVVKKMKSGTATAAGVKAAYNRYLLSFDSFYRKLGCSLSELNTSAGGGRISRRERHASKSSAKPQTTVEATQEPVRKQMASVKAQPSGKETTPKAQKSSIIPAAVSKSISLDAGQISPKPPGSREASKERSPASPPLSTNSAVVDDELVVGARVKVKYGSGNHRKLYQAKIMKIESGDRFVVHYLGWNTRYDEAVPRSRIVEVVSAVAAASSDSGVSNNDQGENGAPSPQKIIRTHSRSQAIDKSSLWRRRRSSGGSTHSLPIGASTTNDDAGPTSCTRKSSSVAIAVVQKMEAPTTTTALADDEGDESGKESGALLSTYKPKPPPTPVPAILSTQSATMKRPASANASSESADRIGEPSVDGPLAKRAKKATNLPPPLSSPSTKRKAPPEESDDEDTAKSGGCSGRRISKRLRGVKPSIEEELHKQQEDAESDEEEKQDLAASTAVATILEETLMALAEVPTITEECHASGEVDCGAPVDGSSASKGSEEDAEGKGASSSEGEAGVGHSLSESGNTTEQLAKDDESVSLKESEKGKETCASSTTTTANVGQGSGTKPRGSKFRRRRRNYSQMVTDYRSRTTANKSTKKDVDSDGEGGSQSTANSSGAALGSHFGGRSNDGYSQRDPNSLQALRHRIQAEMDADPSKYKSNFAFNVIDESLDSERKIQVMQANILELKETYLKIRSELSQLEKCRKKILEKKRKQERRATKAALSKKNLAATSLSECVTKSENAALGNELEVKAVEQGIE